VLGVNAGSSSLKLSLLGPAGEIRAATEVAHWETATVPPELASFLNGLSPVDAVGHRMVHGGPALHTATIIDARVRSAIEDASDLAPLHQPRALAGIDAVARLLPGVPAVACFDTAFHATMPAAAATYALPAAWRTRYGLRRYGFTGCRTRTPPAARRSCWAARRSSSGSCPVTSGRVPRWRRWTGAAAWTRRWASARWKGW
jgi:acetate kinase